LSADDHERLKKLDPLLRRASQVYGVDLPLIQAVIKVESDFDHRAVSSKGAQGLMQLMPETAQDLGVVNCFNPIENIDAGVRYLRQLLEDFQGHLQYALAAYNAGKDAVMKYGGIPPFPETQQYVQRVLRYYGILKRNGKH
jgi:soluble lytic murein transglycosylase-like protein